MALLALAPSLGALGAGGRYGGPPPIVPRWAFEPWVWEDNGNTRTTAEQLVEGYRSRDIPVGAIIIDSPWSTAYNDFNWNTERYPDAAKMIREFQAKNVRVILWLTGLVNNESKDVPRADPAYDEVQKLGYAVNDGAAVTWWKGSGRHVDFTNPAAREWWGKRMDQVSQLGVDGWKVDQGEAYLPDEVQTSAGKMDRSSFKMHYYAAIHQYAISRNPNAITLARPYSHQDGWAAPVSDCSIGWSGDFSGDWEGIRLQIDNLYRSAQRGYGALSVEVGGFYEKKPTKPELIRYAQFGALMPVMINGGSNGGLAEHLPWFHDEETVRIYRYFATLHSELGNYLFSNSVGANRTFKSIVRDADLALRQHRLGLDLFVSLLAEPGDFKRVRMPDTDTWIDWWNQKKIYSANAEIDYHADLSRMPLFVRAGAILPLAVKSSLTGNGDAASAGKETLVIFPGGVSDLTYSRPLGAGIEFETVKIHVDEVAGEITLEGPSAQAWRFRVKCFAAPAAVEGGDAWSYDAESQWLTIDKAGQSAAISIKGWRGYTWLRQATAVQP